MKLSIAITIGLVLVVEIHSYNILMTTLNSKSHKVFFDAVAEELGKRGHQVTLLSSIITATSSESSKGVRNVHVNYVDDENLVDNSQRLTIEMDYYVRVTNELAKKAEVLYRDPFVEDLVKNPTHPKTNAQKYDVVIVDAIFNEFALALAHHLRVPSVLLSPTVLYPHTAWYFCIPHYASYISSPLVSYSGFMDYNARFHNTWVNFRLLHALYFHAFPAVDAIVRESLPAAASVFDLLSNASLLLTNTNSMTSLRVPTTPYFVEIGGLQCKPAKKLPADLENFVQSSKENGVVYVSIDGRLRGKTRDKIVETFAELQQKVIWRYDEDLEELPKNILLLKTAPQQDILGHEKVKLFVTDGSSVDIHEAVYHGVPIVGLPFTTHQLKNVDLISLQGSGESVDLEKFTTEELVETMRNILGNESYTQNAKRMSKLLKDWPEHPSQKATFWIEYVIRNDGAPYLKTGAENLASYQYFQVDTYGAVFAIFGAFILLIVILIVMLTPLLGRPHKGLKKTKVK